MDLRRLLFAALIPLLAVHAARAGTIRHDVPDSSYTDLASQPAFDAVGKVTWQEDGSYYLGSGTYIGDGWVLTAAHVVDGNDYAGGGVSNWTFRVAGQTYQAAQTIIYPGWTSSLGDSERGYDIALVQLTSDVSGVSAAVPYGEPDEKGSVGTIVGYGATGDGLSGYDPASYGVKRAGQNDIDKYGGEFGGGGYVFRYSSDIMFIDFDNPADPSDSTWGSTSPLALEYMAAPGDSGGGLFVEDNGTYYLAGVTAFLRALKDGEIDSDYGDQAGFTRVSQYSDWIYDNTGIAAWILEPQWGLTGDGSYNNPQSWTENTVPDGEDAAANFLELIESNCTVAVDPGVTVGTIRFRSPEAHPEYGYTIQGPARITLEASGDARVIVERGDHKISAPLSLFSPGLTVDTAEGTELRIEPATDDFSSLKEAVTKAGAGSLILGPQLLVVGPLNVNEGVLEASDGVLAQATTGGPPRTITLGAMATLKASGYVNGLVVDTGGLMSPSTLQAAGPMQVGRLDRADGYNYAGILNADTHSVVLLDDDKADVGLALIAGGSLTGAKGIQLNPATVGFGGFITGSGAIHGVVTAGTPGNPAMGFGGTPPGITVYGDVIGLWNQFDNTTVTGKLQAGFSPAHNPLGPGSNAGTAQFLIGGPLDGEVTFNSEKGEYEKTTGDHTQFLIYGVVEGQPAGAPTVFESLELKLDEDYPDFGWDDLAAGDDIVLIQTAPWQTVQFITLPFPHYEATLVGPGQVEYGSSFEGDLQSALDLIRPKLGTGLDVTYTMNPDGLALHIVPEPGTLVLLLSSGLALLLLVWRRRRRS